MSRTGRFPFEEYGKILLLASGWLVAAVLGVYVARGPMPPSPVAVPVPAVNAENKLERLFREWAAHPQLAGASVAFCVLDEEGRTVFASPLAETALCPASALKIVTTGAALGILGPGFRFETTLIATTPVDSAGVVAGDLVLVGGGDPTFSQDDLAQLVNAAVAVGLKSVAGAVRVDASVFPEHPMSEHWNWATLATAMAPVHSG